MDLGQSGIRGVVIYSKKSIQVKEIELKVEGAFDHVWIEIPRNNGESILCGCIYRTQSGDTDMSGCMRSNNAIRELITSACQHNKNVVIAGDFNYKNIDWENQFATNGHRHLIDFIDTLQECFLFQHVTEPTRHRANEASNILDLVLSSEEGIVKDLSYHPPLGQSDHICLKFKVQYYHINSFRPKRNVFKSDYNKIKEKLLQHDWLTILNTDFENDYDKFTKILYSALESHTPMTQPPKRKTNIYMTNEAIRLKNRKAQLWKRYLSTKTQYDRGMYTSYD